jgi:hypothetical protein
LKHSIVFFAASLALSGSTALLFAQAAPLTAAEKRSATTISLPPSPKALLPDAFAGWIESGSPQALASPAQADPANAAALKEYGFASGAVASYKRDGETLSIRAFRFADATGAYGAYSFYRQNNWPKESIGTGAASNHNRVLFWKGTTVIDANFLRVGPMSAGELRELASQLPSASGNSALPPPILANLPQAMLDGQTTHYAVGAAGYAGSGGVLPPSLVGFDKGAEAVTANYSLPSGTATLTLIDCPTPQIAEATEAAIRAYLKAGSQAQPPWPKPLVDSDQASFGVRHSGPLVVLVSGDVIPDDSHRLLESVHYAADLTSLPQSTDSEIAKTGKLLVGIAVIVLVGAGAAIFFGGLLGGGRALYRLVRGKPISSLYDEEFISLNLREKWDEQPEAIDDPHPKR